MRSNLYTISDDAVEKNKEEYENNDSLAYEVDYFSKTLEPMLSRCLQDLSVIKDEWVSSRDNYRLQFEEKKAIALHIASLFLRHPVIKESVVSDFSRMQKAELDIVKNFVANQLGDPKINELEVGIEFDESVVHANSTYLNHEYLDRLASLMAENYWIFWYRKEKEFYTSDFPIVVVPHAENVTPTNWGLTQYGGELTFPLFPDCVLSIYDRHYFSELSDEDCIFKEADDKRTRVLNFYRYIYMQNGTYCHIQTILGL